MCRSCMYFFSNWFGYAAFYNILYGMLNAHVATIVSIDAI